MERALAKVKHHSKEVSCLRTWQKKRPSKCECQCECDITNISKNKRARIHTRAVRLQAKFIHVRKCAILSLSLFSAHTFACTHFQKSIFYLKNFLNHKSDLAIYSTFALYYANVFLFVDFDIFRVHEHFGLILLLLLARLFFFSPLRWMLSWWNCCRLWCQLKCAMSLWSIIFRSLRRCRQARKYRKNDNAIHRCSA